MPERVHELEFDEFDRLLDEIPRATVTPNAEEFGVFNSSKNTKNGAFLDSFSDEKLSVKKVQFDRSFKSVFQDLSIKDRPIMLSANPSTPFDFNGQQFVTIPMIPNQQQFFFDTQSYFHSSQQKPESAITWRNFEREHRYHQLNMHQFCKNLTFKSQQAAEPPSLTRSMTHNQKVPEKILTSSNGLNRDPFGSSKVGNFERKEPVSVSSVVKQKSEDFGESIYCMAKDQQGCRSLQKKFSEGNREILENIFREVIVHIIELMTDPFGNYLVHKLLEVCDKNQHIQILRVITRKPGDLVRISCDMHGTRAVQKVVETLKTREQCNMVVSALKHEIIGLMKNMNGNHVAQRFLQYLKPEFNEGGDLTEIGERGVNISGGQKQRVSMARAVYSNSDVYVFDDPLSALDAHVARQVFDKCIKEELKGKTRVLVTNQLHFLSQVDRILLVHEGMVKEEGSFEELSENGPLFQKLMENAGKMEEYVEEKEDAVDTDTKTLKTVVNGELVKEADKKKETKSILIKQEERETCVVTFNVLKRYKDALGGWWVVIVLFGCYFATETLRISSSTWLSIWTDESTPKIYSPIFYNIIYALLSLGQVLVTLGNSYSLIMTSLYAARKLHNAMLNSILRAPMVFFHTNPLGRIINKFAKDLGDIDRNVSPFVNMFLGQVSQLLSTFVLIGLLSTMSLWAILPLLLLFYAAYMYYQSTAREVKRLDSITRSPVYAQFGEALNGLSSIRAYKAYDRMAKINGNSMDNNIRFTLVNMSANLWLAIRLETVGGLMIWLTATFAVMQNGKARNQEAFASTMGLLLSYALNITSLLTVNYSHS